MSDPTALEVYGLQLDRVRLRAIATRHRRDGAHTEAEQTRAELLRLEETLTQLRQQAGEALRDFRLASLLRLSSAELDLLWSAVAATMDPALSPHIRELAGGEARQGISIALHAIITGLDHAASRALMLALTPLHPLLRYGLLETTPDTVPAARPFRVPMRVASYLAGEDTIDETVLRAGGMIRVEQEPYFDEAQLDSLKQIIQALAADEPVLLVIEGPVDVGKRTAATVAALTTGRRVLQLDVTRLSPASADLERSFIALRRECLLDDAMPLVAQIDDLASHEADGSGRLRVLGRLLDETPISVILTSSVAGLDLGTERRVLRVTMPVPGITARAELWQRMIGDTSEVDLELVAVRYRLGAGGIRRATSSARLLSNGAPLTTRDLVQGVRNGIAERLGALAQRVEVKQSWDDLVLSPDTIDQITALVARVRHGHLVLEQWGFSSKLPRGLGTAGLFSGPPGTGKTMVAGLIARELELELYQVDLSKVVSKWVGETEKQLAKIFDAADAGHALLLFDEADSLFAKRTEVKSAIDRYANLEVNYLLQRIESFGGISILTTNLDTSIDPALRRRLAAHIVFYPPDVAERVVLWEQQLPAGAPRTGTLDFEGLADEFPDMTGSNIRNAVLAGAFLAASEGSTITQRHLERAALGEYRAMGRVIR
ncbi:MAG: ATP-binding protein [Myxococcota bacterium]|nr:ATP-binding protein [Myxococcota bacterium]